VHAHITEIEPGNQGLVLDLHCLHSPDLCTVYLSISVLVERYRYECMARSFFPFKAHEKLSSGKGADREYVRKLTVNLRCSILSDTYNCKLDKRLTLETIHECKILNAA